MYIVLYVWHMLVRRYLCRPQWVLSAPYHTSSNERLSRALCQVRKADFETGSKRTYDAAFAAPTARKTLWAENGSQSGSERFAQLNDSFLRGLRGFEPPRGRGVPPVAKQDPQSPS